MASFNKFNSFVEAVGRAKFNLNSDTLQIALSNTAPTSSNAVLTDITEIAYTNLSTRVVSGNAYSQSSGTGKLTATNLVLTASGAVATFRYVVLYDNTATNKDLIGWWDYGSAVTLANGETFTINFDATNGILQLA